MFQTTNQFRFLKWQLNGVKNPKDNPVKPNEDDFRTRFWTAAVHRPAYERHKQLGL